MTTIGYRPQREVCFVGPIVNSGSEPGRVEERKVGQRGTVPSCLAGLLATLRNDTERPALGSDAAIDAIMCWGPEDVCSRDASNLFRVWS